MKKLQDLIQERNLVIAQMRTMLDVGIETPEQEATYERFEKEEEQLDKSIARAEKLAKVEEGLRQVDVTPTVETPQVEERQTDKQKDDQKRYRDAFENYLRMGIHEISKDEKMLLSKKRAVLNTGTNSEGGYLVPQEYLTTVINKLLDMNVMRQISNVIQTSSTTNIPLGDGRPSFSIIAENGAYGTTDASFGQVVLGAYKLGGIIQASDELIQDSFVNLEQYLTNLIVEGVADAEETYFTTGTGSGQAQGIVVGGTSAFTSASGTALTLDEIIDLKYSLKAPYRMNGNFVMNSLTEKALRKLKDNDGQYLWQPSLQLGAPNTFDGKNIFINEKMQDIGVNNKPIAFGDFNYFTIADRGSLEVKRLEELYAANGQIGWRVAKRFDSKVTQAEAIQYITCAAV